MQFPPAVWGPFFWHTIHIAALGYPKEPTYTDKRTAKEFYESFAFLLPCGVCREHYSKHLHANPIATFLDTRKDLLKWTIMIHNEVNRMLNKPVWTEQEVIDLANNTEFGLAAYFFSKDIARIWRVAEAIEAGMIGINTGIFASAYTPFGGIKQSGIGREGAKYGMEEYLELKTLSFGNIK